MPYTHLTRTHMHLTLFYTILHHSTPSYTPNCLYHSGQRKSVGFLRQKNFFVAIAAAKPLTGFCLRHHKSISEQNYAHYGSSFLFLPSADTNFHKLHTNYSWITPQCWANEKLEWIIIWNITWFITWELHVASQTRFFCLRRTRISINDTRITHELLFMNNSCLICDNSRCVADIFFAYGITRMTVNGPRITHELLFTRHLR